MNTFETIGITVCTSLMLASYAVAEEMTVEYAGTRGVSMKHSVVLGDSWNAPTRTARSYSGPAGLMQLNLENGGAVKVFCSQIDQMMLRNEMLTYTQTSVASLSSTLPMGEMKAHMIANHYFHNYSMVTEGNSGIINAAFQLVIWEISGEDWDEETLSQLNLEMGAIQFVFNDNSLIANRSAEMLSNLTNNSSERMKLSGWTNELSSDFISVVPGPTAAIAGVLGLAGLRRRRRN